MEARRRNVNPGTTQQTVATNDKRGQQPNATSATTKFQFQQNFQVGLVFLPCLLILVVYFGISRRVFFPFCSLCCISCCFSLSFAHYDVVITFLLLFCASRRDVFGCDGHGSSGCLFGGRTVDDGNSGLLILVIIIGFYGNDLDVESFALPFDLVYGVVLEQFHPLSFLVWALGNGALRDAYTSSYAE